MCFKLTENFLKRTKRNKILLSALLSILTIFLTSTVAFKAFQSGSPQILNRFYIMLFVNILLIVVIWRLIYIVIKNIGYRKLNISSESINITFRNQKRIIPFDSIKKIDILHKNNIVVYVKLITPKVHPGFLCIEGYESMDIIAQSLKSKFDSNQVNEKWK